MKKKRKPGFIRNCMRCVSAIVSFRPKWVIVSCVLTTIYAALWVLQTVVLQALFDTILKKDAGYAVILPALLLMAVIYLLYHIMEGVINCYPEVLEYRIKNDANNAVFKKISSLGCMEFEDVKRLEGIEKATVGTQRLMWISETILDMIFYYIAYFIFMGWYLFSLKPVLVAAICIAFFPSLISQIFKITAFKKLEDSLSPYRREAAYYKSCVLNTETRQLGATAFFEEKYRETTQTLNHMKLAAQTKKKCVDLLLNILTGLGYVLIIYMIFTSVLHHEISIGAFSAVLVSIGNLYRFMDKLIVDRIGWAMENIGSVENYLDFADEKTGEESTGRRNEDCRRHGTKRLEVLARGQHKEDRERDKESRALPDALYQRGADIRANNVSFSYPGSKGHVLDNINLNIRGGEVVALVGENGSGKTTLCRILLGLYPPTSGEVRYGNKQASLTNHKNKSAVFQDFCKYKLTLGDNIRISDFSKESTEEELMEVLRSADLSLADLRATAGLDTMLGREFGGLELSGGQWQRLAIGRGIYRDSELLVLDEPTAAIDPMEESRIYKKFIGMSKGKTTVLVTHRLGAARIADRIIVLDKGRIAECGTHEELLAKNGVYKKMYESQASWYGE